MTIEERVRRVLEHAVATEPPPRRAPLDSVRRRRRRRPVLAGAVAVVLVMAAVVGLAAVRRPDRVVPAAPTLTTLPTAGWAGVDHRAGFSFLRPPGWELRREDNEGLALIPPDARPSPGAAPRFRVRVAPGGYWRNNGYWRGRTPQVGRLPGGQAYLLTVADPPLQGGYAVDWGRVCRATRAPGSCLPTSVHVEFTSTGDARLWDRYRPVIETIVGSLRPLRPTDPTTGDRSRPACTADQWKLVYPNSMAGVPARQRTVVPAGVGFRGGRPCHLRVQVSMALEQGGRPLAVRGNPAPATIELDLPEDALPAGYQGVGEERILQLWTWDQECVPVPGTDLGVDIVFRDERGGRLLALPTLHFEKPGPAACGAPGAASVLAPWP